MTAQEVLKGNKLIAEFIEYPGDGKGMYFDQLNQLVSPEYLPYHRDWNWLMGVVEKIESVMDVYHGRFGVHIVSNGCTIQSTRFRSDEISEPPHYFSSITLPSKIESTWVAVVEFIKWYNIQKDDKQSM
jgi:hypothetical protein